jgi:hypothetical protein
LELLLEIIHLVVVVLQYFLGVFDGSFLHGKDLLHFFGFVDEVALDILEGGDLELVVL